MLSRMDIERTMEFILQQQAKAEARQAKADERQAKADGRIAKADERIAKLDARLREGEAKAQREMAAIRTLIRAGMKMIARNEELVKDLTKVQKVTEVKLQGLIASMRRGGNGNHRNN